MSADSLIAVVGLLLGFYAIAPRWLQLDLELRLGRRHLIVLSTSLLAIYYLLLYPFFMAVGFTPRLGLYRWNLSPADAAFLVVTAVALYTGFSFYYFKLTRRGLPTLK